MSTSLEDRLSSVEQELTALKRLIESQAQNGWRGTFGMFSDDPEFDEILRRGREIRARERDDEPEWSPCLFSTLITSENSRRAPPKRPGAP